MVQQGAGLQTSPWQVYAQNRGSRKGKVYGHIYVFLKNTFYFGIILDSQVVAKIIEFLCTLPLASPNDNIVHM